MSFAPFNKSKSGLATTTMVFAFYEFGKTSQTFSEEIGDDESLQRGLSYDFCRKYRWKNKAYMPPKKIYNLYLILTEGCRVKSRRGVQFCKWASGVLKEYMRKGFDMKNDLLEQVVEHISKRY